MEQKLTKHQKQSIKILNPWCEKEARLRNALEPARYGPLNRVQIEELIWASYSAARTGLDASIPKILDEMFGARE